MKKQEFTIFSKLVQIAFRGVYKNWRHSFAAILSVAAGFIASALFQGFIDNAALQFDEGYSHRGMLGHILIQKKGYQTENKKDPWKYSLNSDDQKAIDDYLQQHKNEVDERVRFLMIQGLITNGRFTNIFLAVGYDIEEGTRMRGNLWKWDAELGKPLYLSKDPRVITMGEGLSQLLGCEPVDKNLPAFDAGGGYVAEERPFRCRHPLFQLSTNTETSQINALEANLVGVVNSGMRELDRQYVLMPLEMAKTLGGTQSVSLYSLTLKDRKQALAFAKNLEDSLNKNGHSIESHRWEDDRRGELYKQGMNVLNIFKIFILLIVAVVASMSIANTVITSISQRTREIGTLRSMGYRQKHILTLFTLEGFFIAFLGSVVGAFVSLTLSLAITAAKISYFSGLFTEPIPLRITAVPLSYLITLLVLCTVALFSAAFVSRQASKLQITEALAHG